MTNKKQDGIEERLVKLEVGRIFLEENINNINKNLTSLNGKVDNHIFHLSKSVDNINMKGWAMVIGYALSFATAVLLYLHR